ncbi:hypothetical protein C5612_23510 [Pseudomonas frederiksbergensis]|uniref:Uncharacterized protein n=1 Tax=Pseudomonas frederiksbergensis TaxID=104087 RepID=A0A2S8HD54_9PSED|nr:hypothetical protein C5612_23510 [Pseudomonas frederiksbergensis]
MATVHQQIASGVPGYLRERACSRREVNIQLIYWLAYRFREQARSHRVSRSTQDRSVTNRDSSDGTVAALAKDFPENPRTRP